MHDFSLEASKKLQTVTSSKDPLVGTNDRIMQTVRPKNKLLKTESKADYTKKIPEQDKKEIAIECVKERLSLTVRVRLRASMKMQGKAGAWCDCWWG
jgi:hypothetical protein